MIWMYSIYKGETPGFPLTYYIYYILKEFEEIKYRNTNRI